MIAPLLRRLLIVLGGVILPLLGAHGAEYGYSYIPKSLYATQVFPVTILASGADRKHPPAFRFDPDAPLHPLSPAPTTMINGNDVFYTFYFKADRPGMLHLPPLRILEANTSITLPGRTILVEKLDARDHPEFCGMIAADCTVEASQVSSFDAHNTLVTLRIRASEANPEAIHIPGAIEEGLEKIQRDGSRVTAEYYFVIPSEHKSITLSYYNTLQHRFVPVTIATDYHNRPVAAQVELNPKASPIEQLKKYGSLALALFFALMFLWQRDRLYLVLLIVVLIGLYVVYKPREKLCIREGSPLYILPARHSRVSTTIPETLHAPSLGEHGTYYKINYRHGIIGWIRHEDLCQN